MEKREGERHDHPHHRSVWFGHQGTAGFDTWHEPASGRRTNLGSTVHREFVKVKGGDTAVIVTRNDYVGGGKKLLADERTHEFRVENGHRIFDVTIKFTAEHGDCKLSDQKDSGFSVRVATSMDVDSRKGGRVINSNGITDKAAWGKRAEWVDYHGLVNGKTVGVAILNHPNSFRHPTPWHVRTYGLFTANPFGLRSLGQGKDSSFTLKKGSTSAPSGDLYLTRKSRQDRRSSKLRGGEIRGSWPVCLMPRCFAQAAVWDSQIRQGGLLKCYHHHESLAGPFILTRNVVNSLRKPITGDNRNRPSIWVLSSSPKA